MATATTTERRPLMDLPTVAKYLGVSERHIRRLVQERRIPFIKWGHPLRFDPDEIDAWLDTMRHPAQRLPHGPLGPRTS
jgi:excisionase family DNA binding protein